MAITDGTAGSGLPPGSRAQLGGQFITVTDVARLDDGTIAGSVLTMDRRVRHLVRHVRIDIARAADMCATTPARELGLRRSGRITPGAVADLVVLTRASTWSAPGLPGFGLSVEPRGPGRNVWPGHDCSPSGDRPWPGRPAFASGCVVSVDHEGYIEHEEKRFAVATVVDLRLYTFDGAMEVRSWDRAEVLIQIEKRGPDKDAVSKIEVLADQQGRPDSGRGAPSGWDDVRRHRALHVDERAAHRQRAAQDQSRHSDRRRVDHRRARRGAARTPHGRRPHPRHGDGRRAASPRAATVRSRSRT